MEFSKLFSRKVKAIEVTTPTSISELLHKMAQTGFQGRKLAEVTEIIEKMIKDKDVTIMMGFAGSLSTAGQWKLVNWFIENNFIDVLVPTGANISEDIVEAMGFSYYKGFHLVNDRELFKMGLNRYYDVYGREDDYLKVTELIAEFIQTLDENYKYSSREFLYLFGKYLCKKGIRSIVAVAAEKRMPIFCPAIIDSPYGDAALIAKGRGFNLTIDAVKDYVEFMKIAEKVKETGVIYIGGGVPKDFIQLFAVTADLLYPERQIPYREKTPNRRNISDETYYPHKYAVQITTDSPQWGGLSGCTFEEAVSWGKETPEGSFAQCYCDATIALPIIAHALAERIKGKRKPSAFRLEKEFWPA
ncbi:MAG: deoxyhypusine synthase family protein [Candidatus Bathyarchaeia archaeon]|jgi:deoxyhypusine synthase